MMPMPICRTRRALLTSSAALAAVAAWPGFAAGEAAAAGLPVVRWGTFRNYQPVFIGIAAGFFKSAGVHVEMTGNFSSGPAIVQAAGLGQLDAGHAAITGLANAAAQGVGVLGVADSQTEFGDAPLQQWFVLHAGPVKGMADLRGRRIAVNSLSGSFYYTTLLALRKHGIAKSEVHFVTLPHERQEQALLAGLIDVAALIDPYSVSMTAQAKLRRLFTGADIIGERQFSLVFFRKKMVEEQADTVSRFLAGYRQAVAFLQSDTQRGNAIMARALGLKQSLMVSHRYTSNAQVRMRDVQFWLDVMRQDGGLRQAPGLRGDAFATDRFNP